MARVRQMKLTQYLEPTPQLPPPPIFTAPHDTVTRAKTDAAMGVLQQQIGDATQRTDVLLQAVVETRDVPQRQRVSTSTAVLTEWEWPLHPFPLQPEMFHPPKMPQRQRNGNATGFERVPVENPLNADVAPVADPFFQPLLAVVYRCWFNGRC